MCSISLLSFKYFGEVSLLLGIHRTASAKSKTQCMLYRLTKAKLLPLLKDYPFVETRMTEIAQSRRRRLAHYLDPTNVQMQPGDEIDAEVSSVLELVQFSTCSPGSPVSYCTTFAGLSDRAVW